MAKSTKKSKKAPRDWAGIGRIALRSLSILLLCVLAVTLVFGVGRLRTHAESHLRLVGGEASGGMAEDGAFEVRFVWPELRNTPGETFSFTVLASTRDGS